MYATLLGCFLITHLAIFSLANCEENKSIPHAAMPVSGTQPDTKGSGFESQSALNFSCLIIFASREKSFI